MAGAGLSRYVGYLMGNGVVKALFEALFFAQQRVIAAEFHCSPEESLTKLAPLPELAEHFVTLHHGNRHALMSVL